MRQTVANQPERLMTFVSRRGLIARGIGLGIAVSQPTRVLAGTNKAISRRVILDNDFGGDPDGLFLLAHMMMSRSVALPLVVGTHYRDFGAADLIQDKAERSVQKAKELMRYLPKEWHPPLVAGTPRALPSPRVPSISPATSSIVREAMRADQIGPLFYAAGGSLTEIALAWMAQPGIGKRLKLVWIGGNEHGDLAAPPAGRFEAEYNFSLDREAAQVVFNESDIEIWQIPRNAFRQMMIGVAELDGLAEENPLGRFLRDQVVQTEKRLKGNLPSFILTPGETYTLGDTALVTLVALQSAFQPDTSSSSYVNRATPILNTDGSYSANPAGRPMRIYSHIDANLTWRDFTAKMRLLKSHR